MFVIYDTSRSIGVEHISTYPVVANHDYYFASRLFGASAYLQEAPYIVR
jgi:hypothetical protein